MEHDFQQILVALTAALGLAFTIERLLQVVKTLFDKVLFRAHELAPQPSNTAEQVVAALQERHAREAHDAQVEELEELRATLRREGEGLSGEVKASLAARLDELEKLPLDASKAELEERCPAGTALVEGMPPPDGVKVLRTFWLQMLGSFAGVVACSIAHFGLLAKLTGGAAGIPMRLDWVLTGILIGAGAQPVHFLIEFVTRRKISSLRSEAGEPVTTAEETTPNTSRPVAPFAGASLIGVPYRGGIDVEALEYVHIRPANPDLIVVHHTGMHSDTTFADVVSLTKQKGWLTGYHCVVLKDGSICAFCRWDRYGNHVRGYNRRSLGIALNGNFEANPAQPFNNADGSYGLQWPSDAQLEAAARVIALWSILYDIPLAFDSAIVPHNALLPTACPGSNFPFALLQGLIRSFRQQWEKSEEARREIALFRQKPFLYA